MHAAPSLHPRGLWKNLQPALLQSFGWPIVPVESKHLLLPSPKISDSLTSGGCSLMDRVGEVDEGFLGLRIIGWIGVPSGVDGIPSMDATDVWKSDSGIGTFNGSPDFDIRSATGVAMLRDATLGKILVISPNCIGPGERDAHADESPAVEE